MGAGAIGARAEIPFSEKTARNRLQIPKDTNKSGHTNIKTLYDPWLTCSILKTSKAG